MNPLSLLSRLRRNGEFVIEYVDSTNEPEGVWFIVDERHIVSYRFGNVDAAFIGASHHMQPVACQWPSRNVIWGLKMRGE